MQKYFIPIKEVCHGVIEIRANSKEEALKKVEEDSYGNGNLVIKESFIIITDEVEEA